MLLQQVGGDRQEIPHQRRVEVRPQPALVGIRDHPVEDPHPAQVDQRVHRAGCQAKGGHQFGRAGERAAEFSLEDPQNGRNKGAGMADADPEHKGG